jgi:hypothetical protein
MYAAPTTPQSIGGVLDSGFRLVRECFKLAFLLGLAAALVAAPFNRTLRAVLLESPNAASGLTVLVGGLVTVVIVVTLYGTLLAVLDSTARGQPLPLNEALRVGLHRGPALFVVGLCYGVLVAVGIVLLVVPGLFLMILLVYAYAASVAEPLGPIASLQYSRNLVRGHWWRTAGLFTIIGFIYLVLYAAIGALGGFTAALNSGVLETGTLPWYFDLVVTPLVSGLVAAVLYPLYIAAYRDAKLRYEGGDLAARIAAAEA